MVRTYRRSPADKQANTRQLEKADETSANDENEVRREDQEKINRFSRLHQRETTIEEQLKGKQVSQLRKSSSGPLTRLQKDKEDLEEVSLELELADEDDLVP